MAVPKDTGIYRIWINYLKKIKIYLLVMTKHLLSFKIFQVLIIRKIPILMKLTVMTLAMVMDLSLILSVQLAAMIKLLKVVIKLKKNFIILTLQKSSRHL